MTVQESRGNDPSSGTVRLKKERTAITAAQAEQ